MASIQTQNQIDDKPQRFTVADAERLIRESATWPLPELSGPADTLFGSTLGVRRNDMFNLHGATLLTQLHRQRQRQRAGAMARAAVTASERERLRVQGGG